MTYFHFNVSVGGTIISSVCVVTGVALSWVLAFKHH